jgi:hypothetical protein
MPFLKKTQKTNKFNINPAIQSWAPTAEKVSDNRQLTANTPDNRHETPASQEPATPIHRQRHPLISFQHRFSTRQSLSDNQQQKLPPATNPNGTNNRQQIGVKQIAPIR